MFKILKSYTEAIINSCHMHINNATGMSEYDVVESFSEIQNMAYVLDLYMQDADNMLQMPRSESPNIADYKSDRRVTDYNFLCMLQRRLDEAKALNSRGESIFSHLSLIKYEIKRHMDSYDIKK